jgi:hypothetical protein
MAPLQLYSSAIIFAPETSIIRHMFKDQIPRWICKLPKMQPAWDSKLQKLEGHTSRVRSVAFSPDSQLLASGSDDQTVRLWNPATGEQLHKLEVGVGVEMVSFSSKGPFLETDRGLLKVECYMPLVSPQTDPITEIFITKQWVTQDSKKLLWLPSEYMPTFSAFQSNLLVLSCSSGQLIFLEFN